MRMSWFDASGIASLATKALKEAQKTIDKALDIKDEDDQSSPTYAQVSPVEESDNFFSSWGLKSPTKPMKSSTSLESEDDGNDSGISEKASSSGITSVMTSSLWGSFTGSFFENSRLPDCDSVGNDRVPVFSQPKRSQSSSVNEETLISAGSNDSSSYKPSENQSQDGVEKRTRRPSRNAVKVDGVVEGVDDEEVDAFSDSRVMLVVRDEEDDEEECLNATHPPEDHEESGSPKGDESNVGPQVVGVIGVSGAETNTEGVVLYNFLAGKHNERSEDVRNGVASHPTSLRHKDSAIRELTSQDDELDESATSPCSSSVSPHTPSSSVSSPSSAPSRDACHASEGGTTGGKRSSESVEVLGSCEEGCATSPEGEIGTGLIESVPVHLGPHGRTPPFGSSGLLKVHGGDSVLGAKVSGGIYEAIAFASDGSGSFKQEDERGRAAGGKSGDGVSPKGVGEREKGASTSGETRERAEVPSALGKGWDSRVEGAEAVSGHGSPESVEVIPEDGDVATSPSSVEVIGGSASSTTPSISASTSTRPSSSSSSVSPTTPGGGSSSGFALLGIHDDIVESSVICKVVPEGAHVASVGGPSNDGASQTVDKKLNAPVDDTSPESVEVIPEEVEEEEMSSSASSTTTTTAVTVLEQQRALVGVDVRPSSVLVASCGSMERSLREDEAEEARSSLESFKGKDVCDNGREKATLSETDELKTSSYLRTLLADAMQEKEEMVKAVSSAHYDTADKQVKDDNVAREHSPMSSERSDLVKVGEEEMSGQTSGDEELDTTTSSDIEIISSPNGDSGSNKSESRRRGPGMAAKMSSTSRQGAMVASPSPSPSTASSSSSSSSFSMVGRGVSGCLREERQLTKLSDFPASAALLELRESFRGEGERLHHLHHLSQRHRFSRDHHLLLEERAGQVNEVEELTKRLSETSDILEARESKLIELSRTNVELQEQNMELTRRLKDAESKCGEREAARAEFEGRLATLDRKLQQANGENELLRMKLKEKMDEMSRRDNNDLAALLKEKEEECRELREEGEKLSKQEMNLTTIIKNLRTAQKNSEKTTSSLRQRLEESENELERVKKSLGMREDVERTQVEAIHNLKMLLEAAEKETADILYKVESERKSLSEEKRQLEEEKEQWNEKERELLAAIEFGRLETERLRETLSKVQEDHTRREEAQRVERLVLERRLVEVEARGEEVGAQASRATRPLLRQLESLQTMGRQREAAWEATEKELLGKLAEAEGKAKLAAEKERSGRQRCATLTSRVSSLESQLMALRKEVETEAALSKDNLQKKEREVARLEGERMKLEEALTECKRCNLSLEERLSVERAAVEAEKRRNALLQDQLREHLQQKQNDQSAQPNQMHHHHKGSPPSPRSSPALSFGHASLDESITSSTWLPLFQEDGFHDGRSINSVFEGHAGIMNAAMTTSSSSSLIESLQSQLKLRDGEVQQLQWELGRGESERSALSNEVSSLTAKMSELEVALASAKADSGKLSDLQTKYDALLQMYGEKVEETEELRLDLQDVKEMYKTQIDQLTKKEDDVS